MREGWTYKKLGEVCTVLNGLWVGKKEPLINIAVIRNTNFSKDCKLKLDDVAYIDVEERQFLTRKLQVGDIIIEKSGGSDKQPVGRPVLFNISDGDYSFSNFTATLRLIDESINPKFLHQCLYGYYRNGETKRMQSKTTGLHNLDVKAYLRLPIPCLSISEQQHIVSELDLLSSIIEKKKAQLKEYDQLAQSIFYDMFGDPIENPNGWEVRKIDDICVSIVRGPFGSALKKEFFVEPNETTYKIYEQKHAIQKNATIGSYYVTEEKFKELSRFELKAYDIIMSCSGTIGELYRLPSDAEKGLMNQALLKFTLNNSVCYEYFSFMMEYLKHYFTVRGSGLQNIGSVKIIKSMSFGVPPLSLQQSFAEKIEAIERQKSLVQQSISETEALFNSRMDYYFD